MRLLNFGVKDSIEFLDFVRYSGKVAVSKQKEVYLDPDLSLSQLPVDILVIFACLVISALFSASETAITSFNELKSKQLLEERGKIARIIETWLRNPTRVLTTILVGNNVVNIFASAYTTHIILRYFPVGGVALATVVMSLSILIFSEIIPKVFARRYAYKLVIVALRFVRITYWVFYPIVRVLASFAELLMRRVSGTDYPRELVTAKEISILLDIAEGEGTLEKEKKNLLSNVFSFGETVVREVMIPRPDMIVVSVEESSKKAVKKMLDYGHSRLPVYEERIDNILGVIHVKDILRQFEKTGNLEFSLDTILRDAIFVSETKPVDELLLEMKTKKRQMAIVVDEHGGTAGLITFEDLIEEIVGEVRDEYDDQEEDLIQRLSETEYLVDGRFNWDDFVEEFNDYFQLEDSEFEKNNDEYERGFDTLGGFVVEKLGHIPKAGEKFQLGQLLFFVKEAQRRRIKKVLVTVQEKSLFEEEDQVKVSGGTIDSGRYSRAFDL